MDSNTWILGAYTRSSIRWKFCMTGKGVCVCVAHSFEQREMNGMWWVMRAFSHQWEMQIILLNSRWTQKRDAQISMLYLSERYNSNSLVGIGIGIAVNDHFSGENMIKVSWIYVHVSCIRFRQFEHTKFIDENPRDFLEFQWMISNCDWTRNQMLSRNTCKWTSMHRHTKCTNDETHYDLFSSISKRLILCEVNLLWTLFNN